MTLQNLNLPTAWPGVCKAVTTTVAFASVGTIATGCYDSVVIQAREAMAITHVGGRVSTVSGSPTLDARIETVDPATGLPSGSLWAANTNLVSGTLTGTTFSLFALGATANIAIGDVFALKFAYNSGTNFTMSLVNSGGLEGKDLPYRVINTGTPTKAFLGTATYVLGSSSSAFYAIPGLQPVTTVTNNQFNNTSSARRGMRFQVPYACRCVGLRFWNNTETGGFNAILYNDAGTELNSSSTAFDGDIQGSLVTGIVYCWFDNPTILVPGVWYRAALEPTSATNINLTTFLTAGANYLKAWPGGQNCHYTTYVASSWTDTATDTVPLMDIMVDKIGAVGAWQINSGGLVA